MIKNMLKVSKSNRRIVKVKQDPLMPEGSALFAITERGIEDAKNTKLKSNSLEEEIHRLSEEENDPDD